MLKQLPFVLIYIFSIWINFIKLENEIQNQSAIYQLNDTYQLNGQQLNDELNLDESTSDNEYAFNENAILNKIILENNNLDFNKQQNYQQFIQQNRSKVYLFKPKQVLDNVYADQESIRQNHLNLPTRSTLSKSFPKLYQQLYQLDKSPFKRDLHQFFRSNVDNLSTNLQFNGNDKSSNAKGIEISIQTIQNVSLDKANLNHVHTISKDATKYDTINKNPLSKTMLINTESSNKNEQSLNKSDMMIKDAKFENQASIQVDPILNRTSLIKNKKLLDYKDYKDYKDFKRLHPIEFKIMAVDKNRLNVKRYIPKIIYSKAKSKKNQKKIKSDEQLNNNVKLIPIIIDDNLMNANNLLNTDQSSYYTPESLYSDSYQNNYQDNLDLGLFYNLNSFDLINTLIDNLISNLPSNLINLSPNLLNALPNDLPRNIPDIINKGLLMNDDVNKRTDKKLNKKSNKLDKKKLDELKRSNQIRHLLNAIQMKELADQLNADELNGESNKNYLIELLKQNVILKNYLNKLNKLELVPASKKKLDKNKNKDKNLKKETIENRSKCVELNNSTICFTNLQN